MASLPCFDTETDPGSVRPRWNKWLQRFENDTTAMNISGDARLKALLLHLAGERVHDIYGTVAAEDDKYADTKRKLTTYFSPKKNIQYQIYMFRKATQEPGKNVCNYTSLRMLANNCDITDVETESKTHIIHSCASAKLQRKALMEENLGLEELLNLGRTLELSEMQAGDIKKRC